MASPARTGPYLGRDDGRSFVSAGAAVRRSTK